MADCGCSGQTGYDVPTCNENTALISDDRYYAMATAPTGQIVIVPKGSNTQAFLKGSTAGMVFVGADGTAYVTATPSFELPTHNPAVDGEYPKGAPFERLMIGAATNPHAWKFLAAPSVGEHVLQAKDGAWSVVEAGHIPGLTTVFGNLPTSTTIEAFGFLQVGVNGLGAPVFQARRFAGTGSSDLPIVLHLNETTGRWEMKPATGGTRVDQPSLGIRVITGLDSNGNPITDGFDVRSNNATLANFSLLLYDRVNKLLYRAPAAAFDRKVTTADSANIADGGGFVSVADGRLQMTLSCNYAKAIVSFSTGVFDVSDENGTNVAAEFTLRVDGVDKGVYGKVNDKFRSVTDVIGGLTPGSHTFEVFVKNTANGAGAFRLRGTTFAVQELIF